LASNKGVLIKTLMWVFAFLGVWRRGVVMDKTLEMELLEIR